MWLNLGDVYAGYWGRKYKHNHSFGRTRNLNHFEGTPPNKPSPNFGHGAIKPKDLIGIPWRVAFALQAEGWYLRSDIIWSKPNPMPESVKDRPTRAHEYIFLMTKRGRYYYDQAAISEETVTDPAAKDGQKFGGVKYTDQMLTRSNTVGKKWEYQERRNRRSVWEITTQAYPGAHFATFPEALVEPCILAGSREGDTVLDPFMGSGTVAWVAKRLGRRAIGYELNPAYCNLTIDRNRQQALIVSGSE